MTVVAIADEAEIFDTEGSTRAALTKNFNTAYAHLYEGRYLAGMVAGGLAKQAGLTEIGYVAAHNIPTVINEFNAFTLGLQRMVSNVTIKVKSIDNWFFPY